MERPGNKFLVSSLLENESEVGPESPEGLVEELTFGATCKIGLAFKFNHRAN